MYYPLYKYLTLLLSPLIDLYLLRRRRRGKEDAKRYPERKGRASFPRPHGPLVWIHAASVGESLSVLPLIDKMLLHYPAHQVLLTTVTVTAAKLVESRLPLRAFHQYLPVDDLLSVRRFLKHWQPNLACWVESELWPNLMMETHRIGCPMILLNARISDKSFQQWQRYRAFAQTLLPCFAVVLAQSERVRQRFMKLGAKDVRFLGNLKVDAPALPFQPPQFDLLKRAINARPLWVAASTHPGEEAMIIAAHRIIRMQVPELLTVIIPRHPQEGDNIREQSEVAGLKMAQRSRKEILMPDTEFYIADTLGELGLFFRLSDIVFMGGSFVPRGGHNPLEPARLHCALLTGPYVHNFTEMFEELEIAGALMRLTEPEELGESVIELLKNATKRKELAEKAAHYVEGQAGVMERVLQVLDPYLSKRL